MEPAVCTLTYISICIMAGCFICMKLDEQKGAYIAYAVVDEEKEDDDDDVVVNVNWFIPSRLTAKG